MRWDGNDGIGAAVIAGRLGLRAKELRAGEVAASPARKRVELTHDGGGEGSRVEGGIRLPVIARGERLHRQLQATAPLVKSRHRGHWQRARVNTFDSSVNNMKLFKARLSSSWIYFEKRSPCIPFPLRPSR